MSNRHYRTFVCELDLSEFLGVSAAEWHLIREAHLTDHSSGDRDCWNLHAALIGAPTSKWLERWRSIFRQERSWPALCKATAVQEIEEPSIPLQYAEAYAIHIALPPDVARLAHMSRPKITAEARAQLARYELLELGDPNDIFWYLESLPIEDVRQISNELGSGRARSKVELVDKILANATPADLIRIRPENKDGWVKAIRSAFDRLPGEWVQYQSWKARHLATYLFGKYYAAKNCCSKSGKRTYTSVDCPKYCRRLNRDFRWRIGLSFHEMPPWHPGCLCYTGERAGR